MDRSLATLLRSLQASSSHEDAVRLLPSATNFLSRLSNPLNVSLAASQVLAAPQLLPQPVALQPCRSIFSVFYTAALRFAEGQDNDKQQQQQQQQPQQQSTRSNLSASEWTRAVVKGADNKSSRWKHLLLLGGILLGFEGQGDGILRPDLRNNIEAALVSASNLALQETDNAEANSQLAVIFVLNTVFPLLSDSHRSQIQYGLLLPELIQAAFFSREGLEHGYWLGTIDRDITQVSPKSFKWDARSHSAVRIQEIKSRPLVSSLGPLSRLLAHTIEHARDTLQLVPAMTRLSEFSRNVALSWRQTKLSELHPTEEADFLNDETRRTTFPELLQLLRNIMFSLIIVLRAIRGRILLDRALSSDQKAPILATQSLHILRDLYFISHRFGQTSSSQYMFVNFTAIDILNQFPDQAEQFLSAIRSPDIGTIPSQPLGRLNDLFFLNTAEHFTLSIRPQATSDLLIASALPYITATGDPRLSELYEAAHSVLLAVFGAPQNGPVATQCIPFYLETLMESFPASLSPRQFRLAIKSLMHVAAPHTGIAAAMPELQEIVLDMLRARAALAAETPLRPEETALVKSSQVVSEKAVFVLCVIETLSWLPLHLLLEWLVHAADLVHTIQDPMQKGECQKRFWEVLSSGDMDVERSALCVDWWTSRGGREMVLFSGVPTSSFQMSGALPVELKL